MKVSIITVSMNSVTTIEKCILSVIRQTRQVDEYWIIDGGSNDGTVDIIRKYAVTYTYIHYKSEADLGISDALNKGISKSAGDFIGIIHADDWYEFDAIEKAVEVLSASSWNTLFCGDIRIFQDEKRYKIYKSQPELIRLKMSLWHPSVFTTKPLYKAVGGFSLTKKLAMDYDFIIRATVLFNANIVYRPVIIANMMIGGISNNTLKMKIASMLEVWQSQRELHIAGFLSTFILCYRIVKISAVHFVRCFL